MSRRRTIGAKATPRDLVRVREVTRDRGSPPPPRGPRERGWFARWFRRLVIGGLVAGLIGSVGLAIAVYMAVQNLPSYAELRNSQPGQMIVVRARDGTELVSLGPSYGQWLSSNEIPQVMKDAMISVEDRRYAWHFGVDPIGLVRAVWVSWRNDERASATSTITQQLARNLFLNSNRSFDRKIREAVLAMALEWKFSKDQVLELYLNKVYFGGGAYGIDSASRKFFSHSAHDLSLAEAAIIAGMVKAPSRYSPTADVQAAVGRANVVIGQMLKYGAIGPGEAENVDVSAVKLRPDAGQNSVRYFTDWILPQLDLLLPETGEPLEVWTTLDVKLQSAASAALRANAPGGAQGALVSLDRDGAVLALVGGTDYVKSNYNRAVNATRQPGSAWKLFVYLAALEAGYTPDAPVVDEPVTFEGWSPRNANGQFAGPIDVRTAFAYSINTVAAQLGNDVGYSSVAGMARRLGITTPIDTVPSMVLGTSDVRLIDMARAFATVAAKGNSVEPYGVTKVTTVDGEILYEHRPPREYQLVPPHVAAGITDLLQTAVSTGTGRAAQIGRPVAGKTGTTTSNKDGWFLGFSSGITTGVWMGRDDARAVPGLQGGRAPARAFAQYMAAAVKDRPVEQFETEAQMPEWMLETGEEELSAGQDDYYYVDENGSLIEPTGPIGERGFRFEDEQDQPGSFDEAFPAEPDPAPPRRSGEVAAPPPRPRGQ